MLRQSIWPDRRTYYNDTFFRKGLGLKLNAPLVRKGESASLSIASDYEGAEQWKTIAEAFGIEDEHYDALKKAVSQAFQEDDSRGKDLLTIENSLLCFLLHFYRGDFSLRIDDNGFHGPKAETYEAVHRWFNYGKYPTIEEGVKGFFDGRFVMRSDSGKKINLYLVSKFSEYFEWKKGLIIEEYPLPEGYYDLFKEFDCFKEIWGIAYKKQLQPYDMKPHTVLENRDSHEWQFTYYEGLRELIDQYAYLKTEAQAYPRVGNSVLGLIDYPFEYDEDDVGRERRRIYHTHYSSIATRLNEYSKENGIGIRVLVLPLEYGKDIKCPDPLARRFYNED